MIVDRAWDGGEGKLDIRAGDSRDQRVTDGKDAENVSHEYIHLTRRSVGLEILPVLLSCRNGGRAPLFLLNLIRVPTTSSWEVS